jgi:ABC-type transport system involved in multi-copper enzyme maturation permease subunit
MTDLLRAELLKLRTTRTFVALTGVAAGTSLIIALLVSILTEPTRDSVIVDVYSSDTSSFFILLLGAIGISGEWRHRTITSSLLAAPDRVRFLGAKLIGYAAAGVVMSLVIAATVAVTATIVLGVRGLPLPAVDELLGQVGRNAIVAALLGAFGVAVGGLIRSQLVAVIALLLLGFVAEPLVVAFAPEVGRYGPLGALALAAAGLPAEVSGDSDLVLLGVGPAIAAMLAWIATVFALGAVLLVRRDLD